MLDVPLWDIKDKICIFLLHSFQNRVPCIKHLRLSNNDCFDGLLHFIGAKTYNVHDHRQQQNMHIETVKNAKKDEAFKTFRHENKDSMNNVELMQTNGLNESLNSIQQ